MVNLRNRVGELSGLGRGDRDPAEAAIELAFLLTDVNSEVYDGGDRG